MLLLFVPLVSAQSVDDEIDNLVYYAEQYEMGNINYLQLLAYGSLIKEDVNDLLGSFQYEEHGPRGISAEAAEVFFGEPTWYTKWAWDVYQNEEVQLDEKLPSYEKVLFDGHRVQITFNAWPHRYSAGGEEVVFYWTEFRVDRERFWKCN
tara:strand:- start:766 stop:1215 length:450 start_codon:yes stop_codon:yes gene_type:complete